jgi:hypothetical protein
VDTDAVIVPIEIDAIGLITLLTGGRTTHPPFGHTTMDTIRTIIRKNRNLYYNCCNEIRNCNSNNYNYNHIYNNLSVKL